MTAPPGHANDEPGVRGHVGAGAEVGLTAPNMAEPGTSAAVVRAARPVVVLADWPRAGIAGLVTYAVPDDIDVLITDEGLGEGPREMTAAHVDRLELARVRPRSQG